MKFSKNAERGVATLLATVIILFGSLAIIGGFLVTALSEVKTVRDRVESEKVFAAAEGGLEDAVFRLATGKQTTFPATMTVSGVTVTVSAADSGNTRTLTASGTDGKRTRKVSRLLTRDVAAVAFNYAVHIGEGGVQMQNNSKIVGNLFSNGSIVGENNATVQGDALAAGTSRIEGMIVEANAKAHLVKTSVVNLDAFSNTTIESSTINRDARASHLKTSIIMRDGYYLTKESSALILGQQFPGTPPPADVAAVPLPIAESQLDTWEADAAAGGTKTCSGGKYIASNGEKIGPAKIPCDLEVSGTTVLTISGPVWVLGDILLANSAQVKLDPSFGSGSSVVIADDPANRAVKSRIRVQNTALVTGSGTAGSYLMMVSRNNSAKTGGDVNAIEIDNNTDTSIFYTNEGLVRIGNNLKMRELTAWKLQMQNSANVTYETGLAQVTFSGGPGGSWKVGAWQEVP
ncbi:hypothetical protein HYV98_00575 [Candidatus Azambacteria bacterium]|nr:hypothetical protein [Candidatus Azambacteria bacterium]